MDIRRRDVIEILLSLERGPLSRKHLSESLVTRVPGILARLEESLLFLGMISAIRETEGIFSPCDTFAPSNIEERVVRLALNCQPLAADFGEHCRGVETDNSEKKNLYVSQSRTSYSFLWFLLFLKSFGVVALSPDQIYKVQPHWVPTFLEFLGYVASLKKKKPLSPEGLKRLLQAKEKAGLEAEQFVFEYERIRLAGHPLLESIQHTSLVDVSAGFDIKSFDSAEDLILNRFIEVKSYTGDPSFYLSSNEYQKSVEERGNYYIYLVDREKMGVDGYHPQIISNPYKRVFSNSEYWSVEPDGFFITRTQPTQTEEI